MEKEALEVLGMVLKYHDCNYGVSWDSFKYPISEVIEGRLEDETATDKI
jgi:hypothetical protein